MMIGNPLGRDTCVEALILCLQSTLLKYEGIFDYNSQLIHKTHALLYTKL